MGFSDAQIDNGCSLMLDGEANYYNIVPIAATQAISAVKALGTVYNKINTEAMNFLVSNPKVFDILFGKGTSSALNELFSTKSADNIKKYYYLAIVNPKSFIETRSVGIIKLYIICAILEILNNPDAVKNKYTINKVTDNTPILYNGIPITVGMVDLTDINKYPDNFYNYILAAIYSVFMYLLKLDKSSYNSIKIPVDSGIYSIKYTIAPNSSNPNNGKSFKPDYKILFDNAYELISSASASVQQSSTIIKADIAEAIKATSPTNTVASTTTTATTVPAKYSSFWAWIVNGVKVNLNLKNI